MSAVASQSINDVFSAEFDNYKILFSVFGSANSALTLRLRVAGADNSSSIYNQQRLEVNNTSVVGVRTLNGTSWSAGEMQANSNIPTIAELILSSPFSTVHTTGRSDFVSLSVGVDAQRMDKFDWVHKANTSFTGFSAITSSGNMTGSVSIYGYAKA